MKNRRLGVLLWLVFLVAAMIIGRLFYVQIVHGKFYKAQALGQQARFLEMKGDRGEIFILNSKKDADNYYVRTVKSLAINEETWTVAAIPQNIDDKDIFSELVSQKIGESKESIFSKLSKQDSYIILKKEVSSGQIKSIQDLKLKGLSLEKTSSRYYPQEKLASQVVGFLGGKDTGQYGIEGYYEDMLKGKAGIKEEKSGLALINIIDPQLDLNGANLYLTIDYNIQFQAELLLKEAKKNIDIESGQIIVLKPDSGSVLAMANFPSFDPNNYSKEDGFEIFQNSAVQKIFEPGSVFKPFIMAMALNEGKISPEDTFVDTGSVTIGPDTVYNFDHKKYGQQTMSGILENSINTGAVYLSKLLPQNTFLQYLEKFGFNAKTGIDLQGEVYSKNELLKKGSSFGFATSSFGQGIEMTPIQFASAFCVFANGGRIVKPYIVEKIVQGGNETVVKPQVLDPVLSLKTVSEVTAMLINVVDRGFGKSAKIPGYYLAGKTGTAEIPLKDRKGYDPDKTIQSFIGFGPALNPQFVILVKLDNPKVSKSALSAAPIFKKLAQYIINYWQIPPDYE